MISINSLTKTYGIHGQSKCNALSDISIEIKKGEMVGIVGPSGSGKSTLLKIIAGFERSDSGTVIINGIDLNKYNESQLAEFRKSNIGFVFQNFKLFNELNALDNVLLIGALNGIKPKIARRKAEDLLLTTGILEKKNLYPYQLSGGEQQRVAIARSLMSENGLILADEPTGNLDSVNSNLIMSLFKDLNKRLGITIVFITHSNEMAAYADRIINIKDGKINHQ